MSYIINIKTTFDIENDTDGISVCCPAEYVYSPEQQTIKYDEYSDDGTCMRNRLTVKADSLEIIRNEGQFMGLHLCPGKTVEDKYVTPYGFMQVSYTTEFLENTLSENGGTVKTRYKMDLGGAETINTVELTISPTSEN